MSDKFEKEVDVYKTLSGLLLQGDKVTKSPNKMNTLKKLVDMVDSIPSLYNVNFYGRLVHWYMDKGSYRDSKVILLAMAYLAKDEANRKLANELIGKLPFHLIAKVADLVSTYKKFHGERCVSGGRYLLIPRTLRTVLTNYLIELQRPKNVEQFNKTVLHARKELKEMYVGLRLRPNKYAQAVLFDNIAPTGTVFELLRNTVKYIDSLKENYSQEDYVCELARYEKELVANILTGKIPFTSLYPLLTNIYKDVLLPLEVSKALITIMTPAQVLNSLNSLSKKLKMENEEIKRLISNKIAKAGNDSRTSAGKMSRALNFTNDEGLKETINTSIANRMSYSGKRIESNVAFLIDKSGSMDFAIEFAKEFSPILLSNADKVRILAFDSQNYDITPRKGMSVIESFKGLRAGGSTSFGVSLLYMLKQYAKLGVEIPEKVIFVTDQEQTASPTIGDAYQEYEAVGVAFPEVIILDVKGREKDIEKSLNKKGITTKTFLIDKANMYNIEDILLYLTSSSHYDIVCEIMEYTG